MSICIETGTSTRIDKVFKAKMHDRTITPKVCNSKKSEIETPLHICTYTELETREGSLWLSFQIVIEKVKKWERISPLTSPTVFKAIKMLINNQPQCLHLIKQILPISTFFQVKEKIEADKN